MARTTTPALAVFGLIALTLLGSAQEEGFEAPEELEHEDQTWVHVVGYDIPESMVSRGPLDGAHGASVMGFRIGRKAKGTMIVTVIDRPAVVAFVGWGMEDKYLGEATRDLRAVFTTAEGEEHVVGYAAGGGHGIMFHSPDGSTSPPSSTWPCTTSRRPSGPSDLNRDPVGSSGERANEGWPGP